MGYYLFDHPPVRSQFKHPRRGMFTGAIGVHTTEGVIDRNPPDMGAENTAGYITRRSDPGSYHKIGDSDSVVLLLPDDAEAYSVATDGLNRTTVNVAFACRTTDLDPDDPWTQKAFSLMAPHIVNTWDANGFEPAACARWLSRDEVLAGHPGLFHHGTVQPWDRSDAFVRHPKRQALEDLLVAKIMAVAAPVPTPEPPKEDEEMKWLYYHDESNGSEFVVTNSGDVRFYGPEALRELRAAEVIPSSPKRVSATVAAQFRAGDR